MDICDAYSATLAAILMGPLVVYWNWTWGITVKIDSGIGFYASMKIEDLKKVHKMDNYSIELLLL